jgi:hypothetical protein
MIRLFITVEDIDAAITVGYTHIRVYTDVSETGTFVTLDGTTALVADQDSYEYLDIDGTDAMWYETAYYGLATGESEKSPPRKGETSAAYATVIEARMDIDLASITDDLTLGRLLDASARTIDRFTGRPEGYFADVTASAKYYNGRGRNFVYIDECVAITAVAVKDSASDTTYTAWTSPTTALAGDGDWIPATGDPDDPEYNQLPYTLLLVDPNGDEVLFTDGAFSGLTGFRRNRANRARSPGTPTVQVTARWGYSATIPDDIKEANLMQAARWYKRLQSSMADTLASQDFGQLMFRQRIDPDVALILVEGRYVVPSMARR